MFCISRLLKERTCFSVLTVLLVKQLQKSIIHFFLFLPNRSSVSVLIYFFYYQNVLELAVCDEDPLTKDDMQFTVLFNVARIRPGETIRETFALKSEVRTENTGRD